MGGGGGRNGARRLRACMKSRAPAALGVCRCAPVEDSSCCTLCSSHANDESCARGRFDHATESSSRMSVRVYDERREIARLPCRSVDMTFAQPDAARSVMN